MASLRVTSPSSDSSGNAKYKLCTIIMKNGVLETQVSKDVGVVQAWINATINMLRDCQKPVLGIGIGSAPNVFAPAKTLHICVEKRCLIFQLSLAEEVPQNLRELLLNSNYTFVSFQGAQARVNLEGSPHALGMARDPIDPFTVFLRPEIQEAATVGSIIKERTGYGLTLSRDEILSRDWGIIELERDQLGLASLDTHVAYILGVEHEAWKFL